ncbi:AQJ64_40280 family protein [Microbispora triticiradicis]|uniref:Amine oxidase n=2 Tax=Microbispora TaxID=2005 RepID=A0ABY3LNQ4_9ACTN|nr:MULTISPECIES: AQJ64_40280 family protein [Microbispora]TLP54490.1 amine oxidase [Microbispora fusca]TYB43189.1 amine oxidase [Microbispora tritici]
MGIRAEVEWVDSRERLPGDGVPVAAAITGRFASDDADERDPDAGQEFWLVRPMYFTTRHFAEDGREYRDCFVDSDGVVRLPYGRDRDETLEFDDPITHWAELPTLPGTNVHYLLGEEAEAARANALREGT